MMVDTHIPMRRKKRMECTMGTKVLLQHARKCEAGESMV